MLEEVVPASVYGFNGKERTDEMYGAGNSYDFGDRMYDPRVGRWFSPDAFKDVYVALSPYSYGANNPINIVDRAGQFLKDKEGNIIATSYPFPRICNAWQ